MDDDIIIKSIESLIDDKSIEIPITEVRSPEIYSISPASWIETEIECSRFGIRNSENSGNLALARLRRLLKDIYQESNEAIELDWKLRHEEGDSLFEKLDRYVSSENPEKIIYDLILDKSTHLDRTFELLRYGNFYKPKNVDEEQIIIKKILWKLGFDIHLFPEFVDLFWKRLDKFHSISTEKSNYSESDREAIRSSAVNLFVSLEDVLSHSLSFIAWALLSDHYQNTKYILNLSDAKKYMALKLGGVSLGETVVEFDPTGKFTLFPLITGFNILSDKCLSILNEHSDFERSDSEYLSCYKYSKLESFPFLHSILFLDLREKDKEKVKGLLRETYQSLTRAQVCDVRNRIEHARRESEFPKREEIEKACLAMKTVVLDLIDYGIYPSVYYFAGQIIDEYKRILVKYKDYKNSEICLIQSNQFLSCGLPSFEKPIVIVPCMHIGDSAEFIRFEFEESSNYTAMWKNYPKKRINDEKPMKSLGPSLKQL